MDNYDRWLMSDQAFEEYHGLVEINDEEIDKWQAREIERECRADEQRGREVERETGFIDPIENLTGSTDEKEPNVTDV